MRIFQKPLNSGESCRNKCQCKKDSAYEQIGFLQEKCLTLKGTKGLYHHKIYEKRELCQRCSDDLARQKKRPLSRALLSRSYLLKRYGLGMSGVVVTPVLGLGISGVVVTPVFGLGMSGVVVTPVFGLGISGVVVTPVRVNEIA